MLMLGSPPGTTTPGTHATTSIPGDLTKIGHRFSHIRIKVTPHDTIVKAASSVSAADRCISEATCE